MATFQMPTLVWEKDCQFPADVVRDALSKCACFVEPVVDDMRSLHDRRAQCGVQRQDAQHVQAEWRTYVRF